MDMKKIGLLVGGIIGFFIGAEINSIGGVSANLIRRITGGAILQDTKGLAFSFGYSLIGAFIGAVVLATILMGAEEIWKMIKHRD